MGQDDQAGNPSGLPRGQTEGVCTGGRVEVGGEVKSRDGGGGE